MIKQPPDVMQVLDRTDVGWCMDTEDVTLNSGEPPEGQGPKLDVRMSVEYLNNHP